MTLRLTREPIDPGPLAGEVRTDGDGAVALFLGTVREVARGREVVRLEYEAYEEMARVETERIVEEARARFEFRVVRIVHRLGSLAVGEISIAIAVAAPHREGALEACRFLIDRFKERVPIWKREVYRDGAAWIGERS
jgi:molybdopterin synthase catalytic subunit